MATAAAAFNNICHLEQTRKKIGKNLCGIQMSSLI
jgi:hypothetical protein